MNHSVTFGEKNTWDDWHIVPTTRPIFAQPQLKEKTVEIPGRDGVLDFSSAIRGYPLFENREGTFEFLVLNEYSGIDFDYEDPFELKEEIEEYLDGSYMYAYLEDDPKYYYEGRFWVDSWQSDPNYSKITIGYSIFPYKHRTDKAWDDDDWIWDTFNFQTDSVPQIKFKGITVTTDERVMVYTDEDYGHEPVNPTFNVTCGSKGMYISYRNSNMSEADTYLVKSGNVIIPGVVMSTPACEFTFQCVSGTGQVSLDFTKGEL